MYIVTFARQAWFSAVPAGFLVKIFSMAIPTHLLTVGIEENVWYGPFIYSVGSHSLQTIFVLIPLAVLTIPTDCSLMVCFFIFFLVLQRSFGAAQYQSPSWLLPPPLLWVIQSHTDIFVTQYYLTSREHLLHSTIRQIYRIICPWLAEYLAKNKTT